MFENLFNLFNRTKENNPANTNGHYKHGNSHLIELHQVVKNYNTAAGPFTALKGIDLNVDKGEFVAVVGKSGSGKSTLINMITGIDCPTNGEIFMGDTAIHNLNEGQMAIWRGNNVGVVFQFFQLLPTLTVIENVMLPMDFCDTYDLNEQEARAMSILEQVEMADQAYKLPTNISGGQQQRAAIARALANNPSILVGDEPTGNLDSKTARAILDLFKQQVQDGKTILMVTHDKDLAKEGSRKITITDGKIESDMTN